MTRDEFNTALAAAMESGDTEYDHASADAILVQALKEAGFSCEALTKYETEKWWYA